MLFINFKILHQKFLKKNKKKKLKFAIWRRVKTPQKL